MENFDDTSIQKSEEMLPKGVPFITPDGYFLSLADTIENRIKIKDFGNKINPFNIPDNYFENLSKHIENKIAQQEFEMTTDQSFFENQKETILNTIKINERVKPELPFEVPSGYFANLTSAIEAKTSLIQKNKVKQFVFYRWVYAAAAVIILSFGIVYFSNNKTIEIPTAETFNTDSLSTAEIISKLEKSDIPEDELIRNIDENQLTILGKDQIQLDDKDIKNIINEIDESELTRDM